MAIKDKKVPSPKEILNSPTSFSQEELKQLRELRSEIDQLAIQLGQLAINEIKLNEAKDKLKKTLLELEKKEINLAKTLSSKYGQGSIDLDSGTFTPTK
jgi:predicted nuclease with TOPRIM domain